MEPQGENLYIRSKYHSESSGIFEFHIAWSHCKIKFFEFNSIIFTTVLFTKIPHVDLNYSPMFNLSHFRKRKNPKLLRQNDLLGLRKLLQNSCCCPAVFLVIAAVRNMSTRQAFLLYLSCFIQTMRLVGIMLAVSFELDYLCHVYRRSGPESS
jgi:hypothetical protein